MVRKTNARASENCEESDHEIGGSSGKGKSLYEILGVERTASQAEIKKAYYKLALRLHPDKNLGDEEAKEKFQLLQKVMSILGDEEKRALYDQTGCTDDEALSGEAAENLQEFFRAMYKKVTEADIEEFEANYRGSESEKKDLKDLYTQFKGNMNRLFCSMLCSDPKLDSHRFMDIIDEAIATGELKPTKAYQKWAKQISALEPPTDPLAQRSKSKKKNKEENDLVALISQRQGQRKDKFESLFSSIISKCNTEATSEPTEEEFEQARARLEVLAAQHGEIHEEEEEEGSESEGIQVITSDMSSRDAMVVLSRNQSKLSTQIRENQRRTDKKFNSIRGFLNKIWDKLGRSSSSSTAMHNPAPFQWSPDSGNSGGREVADSESESL